MSFPLLSGPTAVSIGLGSWVVIQLCAGHSPSVLRVQRAPYVDGSEQREDVGLQGLDEGFESGQRNGDNEGRHRTENSDDARADEVEGGDAERREQ